MILGFILLESMGRLIKIDSGTQHIEYQLTYTDTNFRNVSQSTQVLVIVLDEYFLADKPWSSRLIP